MHKLSTNSGRSISEMGFAPGRERRPKYADSEPGNITALSWIVFTNVVHAHNQVSYRRYFGPFRQSWVQGHLAAS